MNYAPSTSSDGLELFFTRSDQSLDTIGIYIATRATTADPFGTPQLVTAAAGYVEAPSISYDGTLLYYCKHQSDGSEAIYVVESALGQPACFAAGTRISTERGVTPVEQLRVGDRVHVATGRQPQPVVWIGRRHVDCSRHPRPRLVWPVRIAAGACGWRRPRRDLFLSPDHAIYLGGVLIPVKYLVNGCTIIQVPMDAITYYHIELPAHELVLAEGLPTESYLDTGDRRNFANGGQPIALFPDFATRMREAYGCAPLIVAGPILAAAQARLQAVALRLTQDRSGQPLTRESHHHRAATSRP